ncbi:MAG: hypothetical protein EHM56_04845 [Chloroflexi bacterium]|nr:MAG: hypothetical protein EHM56_04845 [Chloroflexota bacterium]
MPTKEIGYTGLKAFHGVVQEEFLTELRGNEAYKRYNEMRLNSGVVGGMLLAIEQSIRGVDWQFVSDLGEDDERLAFLDAALAGMDHSWNDHIIEALTMLPFGYSFFEIVYRPGGQPGDGPELAGRIAWKKLAIRGQDTLFRWELDETGAILGMWQCGAPSYKLVLIPAEKSLHYRTRVEKNNPEGRSILRTAWVHYYYAKNVQQIEAIGIERDLAGLPVITLPENADTNADDENSDAGKAAEIVRNIRRDEQEGIVLPNGWTLVLLSTGGSRQFDTDGIIHRYESRILMSALAQFLTLGQSSVGTQALSVDMTEFFTMATNAVADVISETFTKYAIPRLLRLNGMDFTGLRLEHSPAGDIDLSVLADFLQKVGDKVTWLPTDESWLRSVARLPEADPEEIAEERERKAEQALAIQQQAPAFGRSGQDKGQPAKGDEDSQDMMAAQAVDRGLAPDDDDRRRYEGRLERLVKRFFTDQQKRVTRGVRRIKRA